MPGLKLQTVLMLHTMTFVYSRLWKSYGAFDKQIADIAIRRMRGHVWYLKICLDLHYFLTLSQVVKEATIATLNIPLMKTDLRRINLKLAAHFQEKTFSDFVAQTSMSLFKRLKLTQFFSL